MANSSRMWVITGRMPRRAAPTRTPVIAFSATGMSRTRRGPYFSTRPLVDPKMAAASGAPSPMTKTRGSFAMHKSTASLSAWTNLRFRPAVNRDAPCASACIDMSRELVASRERTRLGEGHRVVDLARDGLPGGPDVFGGHDPAGLEPLRIQAQRVPGHPGLELALGPVAEMAVVEGAAVLEPAIGLQLQERGALPGPRVSDREARQGVHDLHVVAVALEAHHPVPLGEVEDLAFPRLPPLEGRQHRVQVVLADHDHRQPVDRREVEALVEHA